MRATIDLAHALDFTVVAEGIEDEETLGIVRELGVDLVQGFQIARPLVPADATRRLRRTEQAPGAQALLARPILGRAKGEPCRGDRRAARRAGSPDE